jgi:hypothetical protein
MENLAFNIEKLSQMKTTIVILSTNIYTIPVSDSGTSFPNQLIKLTNAMWKPQAVSRAPQSALSSQKASICCIFIPGILPATKNCMHKTIIHFPHHELNQHPKMYLYN